MLQQEIDTLREKALEIISDYIKVNGKHGFALISYKDNPECYISFTTDGVNRFPYLQSSEFNGNRIFRINGNNIDGIVEIADAIQEHKNKADYVIYAAVAIKVKASSFEGAKINASRYLTDKGVDKKIIIIEDKDCYKL